MNPQRTKMMGWKRCLVTGCLCLVMAALLQACMPLTIARTGVSGTMAVTDRRTFGTQIEDKTISFKGESVADAIVGDSGHVNVTCFNRLVLITGEVPHEEMKVRVEREVARIPNVKGIVNELVLAAPSSLSARSSDSLITAQIAARFVNAEGLYSNSRKTVTERGTVYLMGRLTQQEGDIAAKVASIVPGVQRVVKVFEYISEEELQRTRGSHPDTNVSISRNQYQDDEEYR
ncbi:BON domain-containing protein [Oxalobacter vibrioformis]|uniref:BON domain-containing protein n=1 Tax=Oxalobacter vibrioformis TaxID=933080 RepID=A0A9E9P1Q4_9BURK|nr:BON domain-containing protein [Oxalobacter vibrioformis]WAW09087.1 BON domain-containing protein [Oxalobacter vibrioformis]